MMNFLASRQGAIIHAAGWEINARGWIFAGKSGAGKSTISNLLHQKGIGQVFSDDRMVLRYIDGGFMMYGTPWPGESGFALNQSLGLNGMFFLKQGSENSIMPLRPVDAMPYLFPVMSIPWYDANQVASMMDFCELLMSKIPMYELTFRADESLADCICEFAGR